MKDQREQRVTEITDMADNHYGRTNDASACFGVVQPPTQPPTLLGVAKQYRSNKNTFVVDIGQTFYREASTCHIVTKICFLILFTEWERESGVVPHRP